MLKLRVIIILVSAILDSKNMGNRIKIDMIIISYAQTNELKETTLNSINSLVSSEDPEKIEFNVIVIESQTSMAPYQYPCTQTIYPDQPFGYHKYLNIGIEMTSSPFICLCNNDLIFHPNWATEILKPLQTYADLYSVSPFCSFHHPNQGFKLNDGFKLGYRVRFEVSGWCIFLKRELFKLIGKLDENYIFWCADNDYANTLYVLRLYHALVTSSIVDHLESKTLNNQSEEKRFELTHNEVFYYQKKWNSHLKSEWKEIE